MLAVRLRPRPSDPWPRPVSLPTSPIGLLTSLVGFSSVLADGAYLAFRPCG